MATMQAQQPAQRANFSTPSKAVDRPTKERLIQEDIQSRSAPASPKSPVGGPSPVTKDIISKLSPGERGSNQKAEAFGVAHSRRVEVEAQVYIDAEVKKAEAVAEKHKAVAEKEKMKAEAKANEVLKREEQRAELVVHEAILKADKVVEQAKEKAVIMKANAKEACEKHIAESKAGAEREKAAIEEAKARKYAEIKDKAETLIASGELAQPQHKGVGQKLKENLICHSS